MRITQLNNRYLIELHTHRIHMLTRKALIWNLKYIFGITGEHGKVVMRELDLNGYVLIEDTRKVA